jgi:hypothetical protein
VAKLGTNPSEIPPARFSSGARLSSMSCFRKSSLLLSLVGAASFSGIVRADDGGGVAQADPAGILSRGPYLQMGTQSGMVIVWRTTAATLPLVRYGLAPDKLTGIVWPTRMGIALVQWSLGPLNLSGCCPCYGLRGRLCVQCLTFDINRTVNRCNTLNHFSHHLCPLEPASSFVVGHLAVKIFLFPLSRPDVVVDNIITHGFAQHA